MDPHLPRTAIAAFEWATGLTVSVRDFRASLTPYLDTARTEHSTAYCQRAKASRHPACIALCAERVPAEITRWPQGAIKRCHGGAVELVLPVLVEGRLEWVLYAGQRRAAAGLRHDLGDDGGLPPLAETAALPPLDQAGAGHLLELLHQLGGRLMDWRQQAGDPLPAGDPRGPGQDRRRQIAWLIAKRHREPELRLADLAGQLELSEDRCGHLVQELFGTGFAQLVQAERLRSACTLLELGRLPLREVARASGFGSRSRFFAAFRQELGESPAAYRRRLQRG